MGSGKPTHALTLILDTVRCKHDPTRCTWTLEWGNCLFQMASFVLSWVSAGNQEGKQTMVFLFFLLLLQCWHSRRGRKGWKQRKPTKSESLLHLNVIPSYVCPVFQDTRTWTSILSAVLKADCLLHFGVFAAVLTLEKLLKAFDCLFALKLCFGLHTPQLILFALQCFSKKNKKHKFWVLCKPYQEYNT